MALKVYDTLDPQGDYPAVLAKDVGMAIQDGAAIIEPGIYYQFGEVDALDLTLAEKNNGLAHEYLFEFIPSEGFTGLTITPEPRWIGEPQYPVGKRCIVSVQMGLAVMGCG